MTETKHDAWASGDNYETYMGRWSRQIAKEFVHLINLPKGLKVLEVGCGTGALSAALLEQSSPKHLTCIDTSSGFIETAKSNIDSKNVEFEVASAENIPSPDNTFDSVVSALVFNFLPDHAQALREMARVLKPNGKLGFYVWDYPGGGVGFMRAFWTAAVTVDSAASEFTEDKRFPYCTGEGLSGIISENGFTEVVAQSIEVSSVFRSFDDLWTPFTLGTGPAPGYCSSLSAKKREELKSTLKSQLEISKDGSIHLNLRAWAIQANGPS